MHGLFPTFLRCTICKWNNEFVSLFVGVKCFMGVNSSKINSRRVGAVQFFNACYQKKKSSLPNSHRDERKSKTIFQVELSFQIGEDWTGLVRNWVIFNKCSKKEKRSIQWFPEAPIRIIFPISQEVLNFLQKAIAFQ